MSESMSFTSRLSFCALIIVLCDSISWVEPRKHHRHASYKTELVSTSNSNGGNLFERIYSEVIRNKPVFLKLLRRIKPNYVFYVLPTVVFIWLAVLAAKKIIFTVYAVFYVKKYKNYWLKYGIFQYLFGGEFYSTSHS